MEKPTCVNCSRGCGDFCILYQRHVDDTKDRTDCRGYKQIGSGEADILFDSGTPYLYASDNPKLQQNVKKGRL